VCAAELGAAVNQNCDLVLGAKNEGMVILREPLRGVFGGFITRRRQLCGIDFRSAMTGGLVIAAVSAGGLEATGLGSMWLRGKVLQGVAVVQGMLPVVAIAPEESVT
jgi:hypothetical protein